MYLIIIVATGQAPIPIISLAMIAATYGLQVSTPVTMFTCDLHVCSRPSSSSFTESSCL